MGKDINRISSFSVVSAEFMSCVNESELNNYDEKLTKDELECGALIYAKIVQDPSKNKNKVEFMLSDLRMILSIPTMEHMTLFQKRIMNI
jgi:hypothetical protein